MRKSSNSILVGLIAGLLCSTMGTAGLCQTKPSVEDSSSPKFEVVSIRPSGGSRNVGLKILPDGFESIGMPLESTLFLAYAPAPYFKHLDEVKGAPSWVAGERYDIQAKLASTDVEQWRNLNQSIMRTPKLLQKMLRLVLAERCNLRIHSTEAMTDGYALRVRTNSPALAEDSSLPVGDQGQELLDGARFVYSKQNGEQIYSFYNTSMDVFATFISLSSQHAIEDRTNLRGRYKFVAHRITPLPPDQSGASEVDMPVPWDLRALGMKIDSEKVKSTIWVVDHIERPSPN
jgi:uncharacterized protein (TIGR03435 family)